MPPNLRSQVTPRRRAAICCFRAQADMRNNLNKVLDALLEALSDIPLEARITPTLPRITTPVTVRFPKLIPANAVGITGQTFGFNDPLELRNALGTQTMALSRTDHDLLTSIKLIVSSIPSTFDCIECNRAMFQGKKRERVTCIDQDGEEFTESKRVQPEDNV